MLALYDIPAPAKLNLFLHVVGRRPDGYHLLQSVFMLIDWCDTLHFERTPDGSIAREDLGGAPLPAEDLCVKAARLLQRASGTSLGVRIGLHKRLPSQAGLGGGSSDAASCLLALNRLWGVGLPLARLEAIGLALGADVPFFLRGRNAWVEGIGERITPVGLPPGRFLVAKPPAGVETPAVFAHPALKRDSVPATIAGFAADPHGFGQNDLQPVAQQLCPDVTQALQWLGSQGLRGRMSGSGSAVFAPLPAGMPVGAAPAGWQVRECSKMEVHPLSGWAASDDSSVGG